jgi:hypothetical protein
MATRLIISRIPARGEAPTGPTPAPKWVSP